MGTITCDEKIGVQVFILLHLPKLFLHALPGAVASAQLHLLKLLPDCVPLKFGHRGCSGKEWTTFNIL